MGRCHYKIFCFVYFNADNVDDAFVPNTKPYEFSPCPIDHKAHGIVSTFFPVGGRFRQFVQICTRLYCFVLICTSLLCSYYLKGRKCRGKKKSREQNVAQIWGQNRDFLFPRLLNF